MSVAAPLVLRPGDAEKLSSLRRSSTVEAGLAQRAWIILLAADGLPNAEIARRVGVSAYDLTCRLGYDLTCRSRHGDHGMVSPPLTRLSRSLSL
jgi:hypothetical protein